jgi:hypothetical protein
MPARVSRFNVGRSATPWRAVDQRGMRCVEEAPQGLLKSLVAVEGTAQRGIRPRHRAIEPASGGMPGERSFDLRHPGPAEAAGLAGDEDIGQAAAAVAVSPSAQAPVSVGLVAAAQEAGQFVGGREALAEGDDIRSDLHLGFVAVDLRHANSLDTVFPCHTDGAATPVHRNAGGSKPRQTGDPDGSEADIGAQEVASGGTAVTWGRRGFDDADYPRAPLEGLDGDLHVQGAVPRDQDPAARHGAIGAQ